jgi:hypothetical protein
VTPKSEPTLAGPSRPLGLPEIPQFHLPAAAGGGTYAPRVYGAARVQFADRKRGLEATRRVAFLASVGQTGRTVDWDAAKPTDVMPEGLLKDAPALAAYQPLPSGAMQLAAFTRWAKGFDRLVARTQRLEVSTKQDPPEVLTVGPKRGGVSVELVAIVWELV